METLNPGIVELDYTGLPVRTFDAACAQVIDYLKTSAPMGMWAVTRVVDDTQRMLALDSPAYGLLAGAEFPFDTSMCRRMLDGTAPAAAPDTASVAEYAEAVASAGRLGVTVGAYVGVPIRRHDGGVFGTLCGYDPAPMSKALHEMQPLLRLLGTLLSAVLECDLAATDTARELERSRSEADTDELTGLLNRRGWHRLLALEEDRYRRFGDPVCVVMADLDQLKEVNDTHGHHVGDQQLQTAAEVLRRMSRSSDVVARLGGDEFGVLAVGAGPDEAAALVARMERQLAAKGVSSSFGFASYSAHTGFTGAIQAADHAMYENKLSKRAG